MHISLGTSPALVGTFFTTSTIREAPGIIWGKRKPEKIMFKKLFKKSCVTPPRKLSAKIHVTVYTLESGLWGIQSCEN